MRDNTEAKPMDINDPYQFPFGKWRRVIVTGGRNYDAEGNVRYMLDGMHRLLPLKAVIEGGCPTGADAFARRWALDNGVWVVSYRADWDRHGRAAGPIRNGQMIAENVGTAMLLAFPGGRGTADCLARAKAAGMAWMSVS